MKELEALRAELVRLVAPIENVPPKTQKLAEGGRLSILAAKGEHRLSVMQNGVGTYFGADSLYAQMDEPRRASYRANASTSPIPANAELTPTDCMEWSMQHLAKAYERAGMSARWTEIDKRVRNESSNDPRLQMRATTLAAELQKDGWSAVYFNPDVANVKNLPDTPDQRIHKDSVRVVLKDKTPYYGLRVKHTVLDYSPRRGSETTPDSSGLEKLEQVPFFFGFARAGYHAFVGYDGIVSETHRTHGPESATLIEETPLQRFPWDSGILMVPPGAWPK